MKRVGGGEEDLSFLPGWRDLFAPGKNVGKVAFICDILTLKKATCLDSANNLRMTLIKTLFPAKRFGYTPCHPLEENIPALIAGLNYQRFEPDPLD
jgi:hypothetical protein